MPRHLPSLSALRAFEAAARHLSFTRAAIELNLTQTAVSHRIKELEGLLSVQLFSRRQSGIALTETGRAYLDAIRPAMAQIAIASDTASLAPNNRLTINCLNAFAIRRLMPALGDFRALHPQIGLRIVPAVPGDPPGRQDFDVAIWYGLGDWPGFDVERMRTDAVFPVCTPAIAARIAAAIGDARDDAARIDALRRQTVVRTVSPIIVDEWPAWLQYAGYGAAEFADEVYCQSLHLSMTAVGDGLGIGIGRTSLVEDDLASGRLVEPFAVRMPTESAYYCACRPEKATLAKVDTFRRWLMDRFGGEAEPANEAERSPEVDTAADAAPRPAPRR